MSSPDNVVPFEADLDLDREVSEEVERNRATPENFDRRSVQDRSGLLMFAVPLPGKEEMVKNLRTLGPHAHLKCPHCNAENFRVLCSATDNFIAFVCANRDCGRMWPTLEVNPVQVNDRVAKDHHIWTPNNYR